METIEKKKKDPRDLIATHIKDNGIKQTFIAEKLGISNSHFSLVLMKKRDLSKNNRQKFNDLYNTDY